MAQARNQKGLYDYMDMNRLCQCGHRLGIHAGPNETNTRPCFNEDPDVEGATGTPCSCKNFQPKGKLEARKCAVCGKSTGAITGFRTALRFFGYKSEDGYAHAACIRRLQKETKR